MMIWCGSNRTIESDANKKSYCGTKININFNSYDLYQNKSMLVCLSDKRGIGMIYIKRIRARTSSAVCLWVNIFIFHNVCHPICEKYLEMQLYLLVFRKKKSAREEWNRPHAISGTMITMVIWERYFGGVVHGSVVWLQKGWRSVFELFLLRRSDP